MHWKAWDQLSRLKRKGGLGFKDLKAYNLAMLGKQLWRINTNQKSLLSRIYKGRYFHKADPLTVPLGSGPSYAWKSIHAAQSIIREGARKVIGNGKNTSIW